MARLLGFAEIPQPVTHPPAVTCTCPSLHPPTCPSTCVPPPVTPAQPIPWWGVGGHWRRRGTSDLASPGGVLAWGRDGHN